MTTKKDTKEQLRDLIDHWDNCQCGIHPYYEITLQSILDYKLPNKELIERIERMKLNERKAYESGDVRCETYDEKMCYNQALSDILKMMSEYYEVPKR